LIAALAAVAFFMGGAIATDGLFGSVVAAWVQAIGSIGAIIGAIYVDRGSARRALLQQERAAAEREDARVSALSHTAEVFEYGADRAAAADLTVLGADRQAWDRTAEALRRARHILELYTTPDTAPLTTLTLLIAKEHIDDALDGKWAFGFSGMGSYKVDGARDLRTIGIAIRDLMEEHRQGIW
jgi:hypothetical protein